MKKWCWVVVIALAFLVSCNEETPKRVTTEDGFQTMSQNGIVLSWKVEDSRLSIKVSAEAKGWISVGIDPSDIMKDARIYIGYVADGVVSFSEHYGVSKYGHKPVTELGDRITYENLTGSEKDGMTELGFSIPLVIEGQYGKHLKKGQDVKIILGASDNDNYTTKHNKKAVITITL